jgi:hypothetical protein
MFVMVHLESNAIVVNIAERTLRAAGCDNTRFAWAGGTCPRFAWAGRIFSPVIHSVVTSRAVSFWF